MFEKKSILKIPSHDFIGLLSNCELKIWAFFFDILYSTQYQPLPITPVEPVIMSELSEMSLPEVDETWFELSSPSVLGRTLPTPTWIWIFVLERATLRLGEIFFIESNKSISSSFSLDFFGRSLKGVSSEPKNERLIKIIYKKKSLDLKR